MEIKTLGGTPMLTTFYVYLTSGCNCACQHCWFVPERLSQPLGDDALLQPEILRHAIKQALPLGLSSIKWTGGEPTLHPRFRDFLSLQQEFGLDGIIETNGMLVTNELANLIAETGVGRVSVSLDGAKPATHDRLRGVEGGFEKTRSGIKALVAAGYDPELILTLQRRNVVELNDFFALAVDLGAGSVKLNIMQPVLRGARLTEDGEGLSVLEILELAKQLEGDWSKRFEIPILLDVPMAFRPLSNMISGKHAGACSISHVLGVLPRGDYALCGVGQHVPELAMGAIKTSNLEHVWSEHPVLQQIREGLPGKLQGVCSDCLMKAACLGSCVAANYQLSGDLLAPYWFCQQAADLSLFPLARRMTSQEKE
jgi:SynChlorMet cassette radical SAM/SPASM protein ScmF